MRCKQCNRKLNRKYYRYKHYAIDNRIMVSATFLSCKKCSNSVMTNMVSDLMSGGHWKQITEGWFSI